DDVFELRRRCRVSAGRDHSLARNQPTACCPIRSLQRAHGAQRHRPRQSPAPKLALIFGEADAGVSCTPTGDASVRSQRSAVSELIGRLLPIVNDVCCGAVPGWSLPTCLAWTANSRELFPSSGALVRSSFRRSPVRAEGAARPRSAG